MVRAIGLVLLTPVVVAVGLTPRADARPAAAAPAGLALGVLNGMFRDVPPALVQAAATPFRDLFKKQTGLNSTVEVVEDCDTLAARMQDKKLNFGVFHGFEWAWVKDRYPDLRPLVVTVPAKKPQAVLVVKTDSKVQEPAHLKGNCVAVPVGTKAHCYLYLERLAATLPPGSCGPVKQTADGAEDVLDAVGAGKAEAALVDIASLTAYENNKPGAATLLRVLARSEPFPPTVVVYRKDSLDDATVAKIQSGLVKANATPEGKAFMFLWKLKGFDKVPADYDGDLKRIAEAYPAPDALKAPPPK